MRLIAGQGSRLHGCSPRAAGIHLTSPDLQPWTAAASDTPRPGHVPISPTLALALAHRSGLRLLLHLFLRNFVKHRTGWHQRRIPRILPASSSPSSGIAISGGGSWNLLLPSTSFLPICLHLILRLFPSRQPRHNFKSTAAICSLHLLIFFSSSNHCTHCTSRSLPISFRPLLSSRSSRLTIFRRDSHSSILSLPHYRRCLRPSFSSLGCSHGVT